jgi:hypothetical protein
MEVKGGKFLKPNTMENFKIVGGEIEEEDYCICNFHDCALKFWFKPNEVLHVNLVQKLSSMPNKLWFYGVEHDFYANSFTKVELIN